MRETLLKRLKEAISASTWDDKLVIHASGIGSDTGEEERGWQLICEGRRNEVPFNIRGTLFLRNVEFNLSVATSHDPTGDLRQKDGFFMPYGELAVLYHRTTDQKEKENLRRRIDDLLRKANQRDEDYKLSVGYMLRREKKIFGECPNIGSSDEMDIMHKWEELLLSTT